MPDEPDEGERPPSTILGSLLGSTDPAILKRMAEERIEVAHYAAIGRVAANWAEFESYVDACSIELATIRLMSGLCFTAQISGIARKMDAYISLARLRESALPSG